LATNKLYKNSSVTDDQRDRVLKRRIIEERSEGMAIFKQKYAITMKQKLVDYMRGKTADDHITMRILLNVLYDDSIHLNPKTDAEKWLDLKRKGPIYTLIKQVRIDPDFEYLSILTDVAHENPDTNDMEAVCVDAGAEQGKKLKKSEILEEWEAYKQKHIDTEIQTLAEVSRRALIPETKKRKLERDENARRVQIVPNAQVSQTRPHRTQSQIRARPQSQVQIRQTPSSRSITLGQFRRKRNNHIAEGDEEK
jgi:hypothetical protein